MMKERLELTRDLLTERGVIFVSIDDHEQAYLKVLMDEIFGEDNFICNFIWEKIYAPKSINRFVSDNHDYILCYRKSTNLNNFRRWLPRTAKNNKPYKYNDNDGRGFYRLDNLTIKNGQKYEITVNGKKYKSAKHAGWLYHKEKMERLIQENRIKIPDASHKRLSLKRYLSDVGPLISKTILSHKLVGHTDGNQKLLDQIFSDREKRTFNYPKGPKLIKYLIKLVPNNENAIILDFFAGSGTAGHAVLELNREDQGKRQFILVTNNENNIAENVTYERLHRIIKGQTTEGKTNFEWLQANPPPPPQTQSFENNNLRVFGLSYHDVSFRANLNNLETEAVQQLQKLNPNFKITDEIDIYYQLASLYPQKNSDKIDR